MDWSSVFESSGDEKLRYKRPKERGGRVGVLVKAFLSSYSPPILYAFTVNYILGVGCLGIPYAFFNCGLLGGVSIVAFVSAASYLTVLWVAETAHRAAMLEKQKLSTVAYSAVGSTDDLATLTVKDRDKAVTAVTATATTADKDKNKSYGSMSMSNVGTGSLHTTPNGQGQGQGQGQGLLDLKIEVGSDLEAAESTPLTLATTPTPNPPIGLTVDTGTPQQHQYQQLYDRRDRSSSIFSELESGAEDSFNGMSDGWVQYREPDVTDLCSEFLGPEVSIAYQIALMLLTSVGLLAYAQIFTSSFSQEVWIGASPAASVLVFASIVVPLSCFELADQIEIQVSMSILRFVALSTLIIGAAVALFIDPDDSQPGQGQGGPPYVASEGEALLHWPGVCPMITTAIFSQLFQHSVPGLVRPLKQADKKKVPSIFAWALGTTGAIYCLTGISAVLFFGASISPAVNLNFVGFDWGIKEGSGNSIARFLSYCVVVFPAMDTLSVFPLIAFTLGNSLYCFFSSYNQQLQGWGRLLPASPIGEDKVNAEKQIRFMWRLVAAIPPVLASLILTDIAFSLQLAGLCGIGVALVTPALLQLKSLERISQLEEQRRQKQTSSGIHWDLNQPLDSHNPYASSFAKSVSPYVVLALSIVAFVICLFQMF